jgi:hypothetical protein
LPSRTRWPTACGNIVAYAPPSTVPYDVPHSESRGDPTAVRRRSRSRARSVVDAKSRSEARPASGESKTERCFEPLLGFPSRVYAARARHSLALAATRCANDWTSVALYK